MSYRSPPVLLSLFALSLLSSSPFGCRSPNRGQVPPGGAESIDLSINEATDHAARAAAAQHEAIERAIGQVCALYGDWPTAVVDDGARLPAATELPDGVETWPVVASAACPEAIPPSSLVDGTLVKPNSWGFDLPGFVSAGSPSETPSQAASRLEWTAVGLGCLALDERHNPVPIDLYLERMGYDQAAYIEATIEHADADLSARIYGRIRGCVRADE